MLFSSSIFIFGFLFAVLALYYAVARTIPLKNLLLFVTSVLFYAWGEPSFAIIMLVSIALNWGFGLLVDRARHSRARSRLVITLMLTCNLGLLFVFKYLMFAVTNINALFGAHLDVPHIVLPIGISFFTFQAISYVMDVYRGHGEAQRSVMNVGLYIAFFPQLIAGPIVRYETIAQQIRTRSGTVSGFCSGVMRFVAGLSKKVLIANQMAMIADAAYGAAQPSVGMAWLGALAYAFQIYFDFSGYSDMAIGLGRMFGFEFLENFDFPYVARSVSEFWRRWHISLGTWFRDYVYFPLGGSRVTRGRMVFNLLIVWALTGMWHGASWNFLLWGLYFFVFIAVEKLLFPDKLKGGAKISRPLAALGHAYTLAVVFFGWVLFRAESLPALATYLSAMFGATGNALADAQFTMFMTQKGVYLLLAAVFALPVCRWGNRLIESARPVKGLRAVAALADIAYTPVYTGLFLICVSYLIKGTYNPFIYFNF